MSRKINFNAGPAALPLPALERAREEFLDFSGSGMSVMEHSHRGKEYEAVHDEAIALVRELLGVPASYEVLLLQGGATALFAQIPMNLLEKGARPNTSSQARGAKRRWARRRWSLRCSAPAWRSRVLAPAREGEELHARAAPSEVKVDPAAAYLHITSNETIHGVSSTSTEPAVSRIPGLSRWWPTCRAISSGGPST